ncbi:ABC transporter permease [Cellulomonas alba]|uniref:ABC transporter permease n=1 Tax=Cellulomonas alba TaxID=3053467 RepID=A0ABT7SH37_9CELL|nr:ABC transporter permease [Cellulomonas alba]MDM7854867.1 ABC transporter permease [Cellulomonas alba]
MTTTPPGSSVTAVAPGADVGTLGSGAAIRLVAGRELSTRLRSKAFVWTTVALVAGVVLGGLAIHFFGGNRAAPASQVAIVSSAGDVADPLVATGKAVGVTIEPRTVADRAAGEALLRSDAVDAVIVSTSPDLEVVVKQSLDDHGQAVLGALAQQLALRSAITDLGGDPAAVAAQVSSAAPVATALEPAKKQDAGQIVAGYITGILLFLTLMTAGQLVAQGVVEEKSSRVVELLLATVRPWQLMAGKVAGIGLVGLIQMVCVVGAGVVMSLSLGLLDGSALDVGATAVWALVWFVVGFTMFALVIAGLSALVSRQEDVGSVIAPIMGLLVIPYIVGISIAPWDPTNPLVVWLSFVPFCSALVMPMRIALGSAETWEALVALAISVALIPALVWLAGRVYSGAVLHQGGRLPLREALRPHRTD